MTMPPGRSWAAAVCTVPVNLTTTPVLAVTVRALSPGATWLLKLDNTPYDPAHPRDITADPAGGDTPGVYLVNLREVSSGAWQGWQPIEVRLFLVGPPGATATFGPVILPAPGAVTGGNGSIQVSSGDWSLQYKLGDRRLHLRQSGALGAVSISLPGITDTATPLTTEEPGPTSATDGSPFLLHTSTTDTDYTARIMAYPSLPLDNHVSLFRWTVTARWRTPHPVPQFVLNSPECRYDAGDTTADSALRVLSAHRFGQAGSETGQAFLPADAALGGTALYVQNFTALAPYFQNTHTSASHTVSADPGGFGFHPSAPGVSRTAAILPTGTEMCLTDSFVAVTPQDAAAPEDAAHIYIALLASIYAALPDKPETVYTDWQAVAEKTATDLMTPACWSNITRGYLRNYVNEPWPPDVGELSVQVEPLVASLLYQQQWGGESSEIVRRIQPSLQDFYLPAIHSTHDYVNEKNPTSADSWVQIYTLIQLTRAAEMGVPAAKTLLVNSLSAAIALAHQCQYDFPVFFNPQTLTATTGSEPDCSGAYAYLMLQAYSLLGDPTYLDEARQALAHIGSHGLDGAYELHITALSAAACARMWKITGDPQYLTLSLVPVGSILRHCWLYQPAYGFHQNDRLFFTLSAMPGVYAAPFEQYESWLALREYDDIAHAALPASVQLLISEFLKYGLTNLRYMYPAYMAPGAVATVNERGQPNEPSLMVPVEDINDGWDVSGRLGQEVYGSGGPMILAARAYVRVPDAGLNVYSEYPVQEQVWNSEQRILRLHIGGVASALSLVAVRYDPAVTHWRDQPGTSLQIQVVTAGRNISDLHKEPGFVRFRVAGETTLLIQSVPLVTPSARRVRAQGRSRKP